MRARARMGQRGLLPTDLSKKCLIIQNHGLKLFSDQAKREKPMGHKRDWKQYNKQLVNRGKINLWIKPEALEQWKPAQVKKNGHPFCYSDELIKTMSVIRFKFKLSLRETEGFFQSFIEAIGSAIRTPCYTQVCRRMKILQLPSDLVGKKNITDIALDTTGLKFTEKENGEQRSMEEKRDGKNYIWHWILRADN